MKRLTSDSFLASFSFSAMVVFSLAAISHSNALLDPNDLRTVGFSLTAGMWGGVFIGSFIAALRPVRDSTDVKENQ